MLALFTTTQNDTYRTIRVDLMRRYFMKVFVVGSGGQGGPCASILSKDESITKILLGDLKIDAAKQVKDKINSPKLEVVDVDASSVDSLTEKAQGVDVIFDMVIPQFSPNIMQAALNVGAHYVSTAFDRPWWDELIEDKPLSFDKEFKDAGLTAVLGCGMAPGFINVMAKFYADKLDTVESIKFRIGKKKTDVEEEMLNMWNPGWSPRQALIDCEEPAYALEEGKIVETPAYSGLEMYDFPEPLGDMKVTHHAHEEPLTIPRVFKDLKYCDFKYYLSPQPAAFVMAGLASQEPVEVNGVEVKPLDLVIKLLPKSENAFLNEDPSKYKKLDEIQYVCLMVEVAGTVDGKEKTYKVHMPKLTANGDKLNELFGTSLINVALPAVIAAKMVVDGDSEKGIVFPEQLDAKDFLDRFLATGMPYEWHEIQL